MNSKTLATLKAALIGSTIRNLDADLHPGGKLAFEFDHFTLVLTPRGNSLDVSLYGDRPQVRR